MDKFHKIFEKLEAETGINPNQVIGILEAFLNNSLETEDILNIYLSHSDFKAMEKQAHKIKGTAANLRLEKLREYAHLLELSSKEANIDSSSLYIASISREIEVLKSQLKRYKEMKRFKILIVEDSILNGQMLNQMITNLGHISLGIVATAESALLSIKDDRPDIIFMDIDLSSEIDGIFLAELISNLYSIPIIFISIHTDKSIIRQTRNYGIGYLVKPFMSEEIEEMIELASKKIAMINQQDEEKQIKLRIKDDNCVFFLDFYDIICIEAKLHLVSLYTSSKVYTYRSSLKAIKELDTKNFFIQSHRSYLINQHFIEELVEQKSNYYIKLRFLDTLIPVSRSKIKELKQFFYKYN